MKVVIVGGGVAGLSLAYLLAKKGLDVTVLEREAKVGGLARSFHYSGWSIDIGPHRFHTDDDLVRAFIQEIMEDRLIEIPRNSKVYFCNEHFDWPLNLESLLKLPPRIMLRAFVDLFHRPRIRDESYESFVLNRYGKTLTNSFFREYNQKFLKMDLKNCHRDWAETGISRATIDKDIRSSSIIDLLIGIVGSKRVDTRFLYPRDSSIDIFAECLRQRIVSLGGRVEVGVGIGSARLESRRVKDVACPDGRSWDLDFLFWTGDIKALESLLGCPPSPLGFSSTVLCNLLVEGEAPIPSQWEYFGSSDIIFSRTSINNCFNPNLSPKGHYGLCAEIVCYENDYVWRQPESLLNSIIQALIHVKVVRNFNSIIDVHFERVRNTYPLYALDYRTHLARYRQNVEKMDNVLACGRTGGFWYNNMDHSIRASIDIAAAMDPDRFGGGPLPFKGIWRGDF